MNDLSLYEQIVDGWERTATENGTPYYVNHETERTSWDHPYWMKIVEGLSEYDDVKYSAYRTSLKIRQLQKQLRLDHVEISTLHHEFEALGFAEGGWGLVHCDNLLAVLVNMFRHTHGSHTFETEPDMLADITLNLLLNMFDREKTGCVLLMSAKLILVTLCISRLQEKYRYFYQELHDPSTFISARMLTTFLQSLIKLPEFLNESLAFGKNCEPAVASCCQMSRESGGVTEDVFYRWLQKEPQTLVWLPTLHRITATENVKHDVKCNVCKSNPILGFRYKCLKCFNFDLCQKCFFTGKTRKKHKLSHPIQEYCIHTTKKDETSAFVKTLRNKLSRAQAQKARLKYLPIEADSQYINTALSPEYEPPEPDVHSEILETARKLADVEGTQTLPDTTPESAVRTPPNQGRLFSPPVHPPNLSPKDDGLQQEREELNSYIQQLEEENRALYAQMVNVKERSDSDSFVSDNSSRPSPNTRRLTEILKEADGVAVREPLPCETTPIYLSVPIIHVNSRPFNSCTSSPKSSSSHASPGFPSAFYQPFSADSYIPPPSYGFPPPMYDSPPRELTIGDSMDNLEASPGKFILPSPTKSLDEFHVEEAELQAIVNRMGDAFPRNLSLAGNPASRLSREEDEMLQAANSVGVAMSDFVSRAANMRLPQ